MDLYVCWGTFPASWRPGGHPCRNAHEVLTEAGWDPKVTRTYGLGLLPKALNPGRRRVRELTGQQWVPLLVTDDGDVVQGSERIAAWSRANPRSGADSSA